MIKRCSKDEFVEGAIFHIYNKTMKSLKLFYNDSDYRSFLEYFSKFYKNYPCTIFAYCLMPNHFHFLIRQDSRRPIYELLNHSLSSYVRHLNSKLQRKGPLFQSKLQHVRVKDEKYLFQLVMYIHNNPRKAGLVNDLMDWKYSNYSNFIERKIDTFTSKVSLYIFNEYLDDYEEMISLYDKDVNEKLKGLLIDFDS
ncbi:MAG: transposase [Candidatus Celaenobacter antarcticus]|nr:transposase [Candidatus Celaenobacter antarcticus]